MAKYGFLGSAFDPITTGHLNTIQEMLERKGFDKIFLMPSNNHRKDKDMHVSDEHRVNMLKLAIEGHSKFEIEDIELHQPPWDIQTYNTMRKLREMEKYKGHDLYFLMGADLLRDIASGEKWSHKEDLLKENKFVVIRRENIDMHEIIAKDKLLRKYEEHFDFIYWQVDNNISSSYIRDEFEIGHHPKFYMPEKVYKYIEEHQLYGFVPEKD